MLEWVVHKYVLHGLGKRKNSPWASHWHTHHRNSRKNDNYDDDYNYSFMKKTRRGEIFGLIKMALVHLPLLFYIPLFYATLIACAFRYYFMHKKAHLDVEWGKKNMPWHYDHHMGKNQDSNWGVTTDWVDKIVGTRMTHIDNYIIETFSNTKK